MDKRNYKSKIIETKLYYDDGSLSCRIVREYNRVGNLKKISLLYADGTAVCLNAKELEKYLHNGKSGVL